MWPCSICSTMFPYDRACDQSHQGLCHDCATLNGLPGGYDRQPHPPPRETPPLALTPRELAAVQIYTRHLREVTATGTLMDLIVTGEEP